MISTELQDKLDQMSNKWDDITATANQRSGDLQEALQAAQGFWEELQGTTGTIKDLQDQIKGQEPPAVEIPDIKDQQVINYYQHDINVLSCLDCLGNAFHWNRLM